MDFRNLSTYIYNILF